MKEKSDVFKYLFIVFLILTCLLGGFLVYDKFINKPNSDIQNNNNNDNVEDNTNDENNNSNQVDDNSSNDNNSNIQNSKNDIEKLKEILKQQAFVNSEQSVENYFEGYLNPIVEVMVKSESISVSTKQVKDLTEEDMARIICLISPAKITSIYPYNTRDIENIYQDNEVKEYVKKYFNKDNYSFSSFKKYDDEFFDDNIVLNSDKSLTCNNVTVSRTIEVTDVIYNKDTGKILVYIDAINPGQAGESNIDFAGTIELKYNSGNFNIVNLDFVNVTN